MLQFERTADKGTVSTDQVSSGAVGHRQVSAAVRNQLN